jgi:3-dehydroquinate synthetase
MVLFLTKPYFTWLEDKLPNIAKEHLTELLERSCRVKAEIVQDDESEQHARKLLNFGHTLGHALESNSHELGDILATRRGRGGWYGGGISPRRT